MKLHEAFKIYRVESKGSQESVDLFETNELGPGEDEDDQCRIDVNHRETDEVVCVQNGVDETSD